MSEKVDNKQNAKASQVVWYVRGGEGKVNGPYPSGAIRRFLLVGTVSLRDEVSRDRETWRKITGVPEVIPPELRRALKEGRVDEVIAAYRCESQPAGAKQPPTSKAAQQAGSGKKARPVNNEEREKRRQAARRSLLQAARKRELPFGSLVLSAILIAGLVGYGFFWDSGPVAPEPDCKAPAGPKVNWRNCSLNGLVAKSADLSGSVMNNASLTYAKLNGAILNDSDLQYADFSGADLSYSVFKNADMKGVNLQNADLSYADLYGADLSFANLRDANPGGTNLEGARFDEAIWFDGERCLIGSVGGCAKAAR